VCLAGDQGNIFPNLQEKKARLKKSIDRYPPFVEKQQAGVVFQYFQGKSEAIL